MEAYLAGGICTGNNIQHTRGRGKSCIRYVHLSGRQPALCKVERKTYGVGSFGAVRLLDRLLYLVVLLIMVDNTFFTEPHFGATDRNRYRCSIPPRAAARQTNITNMTTRAAPIQFN